MGWKGQACGNVFSRSPSVFGGLSLIFSSFSDERLRGGKRKSEIQRGEKKTFGPSLVHLSRADLIWTSLGVTGAKIAQISH